MADSGVAVRTRDDFQIVTVAAFRDRAPAVVEQAWSRFGLTLRDGPYRSEGSEGCGTDAGAAALGIGPRRWLFVRPDRADAFVPSVARAFEGIAAVSDQSDAYVVFEVTGEHARSVLAKGVPVDLHPRSFTTGDVAVTTVAHTNAILWRMGTDAAPHFCLATPRSYAESLRLFLKDSSG